MIFKLFLKNTSREEAMKVEAVERSSEQIKLQYTYLDEYKYDFGTGHSFTNKPPVPSCFFFSRPDFKVIL